MEKKMIEINSSSEVCAESSRNMIDQNFQSFDVMIENYFNPRKMEQELEQRGYAIPKLLVERKIEPMGKHDDDYQLPTSIHDIYEETTYSEFQKILARIHPDQNNASGVIHFKIDYDAVWKAVS